MFKKDQILVLICMGFMIQWGSTLPSSRYESKTEGHYLPVVEEEEEFVHRSPQSREDSASAVVQENVEDDAGRDEQNNNILEIVHNVTAHVDLSGHKLFNQNVHVELGHLPIVEDMDTYVEDDMSESYHEPEPYQPPTTTTPPTTTIPPTTTTTPPVCDPKTTCHGQGTCQDDGTCKCSKGFLGKDCSKKLQKTKIKVGGNFKADNLVVHPLILNVARQILDTKADLWSYLSNLNAGGAIALPAPLALPALTGHIDADLGVSKKVIVADPRTGHLFLNPLALLSGGTDKLLDFDSHVFLKITGAEKPKAGCNTTSGPDPHKPCIFPFKFLDITYNGCTTANYNKKAWCSTKVDDYGTHVEGKWGHCDPKCEKEEEDTEEDPKVVIVVDGYDNEIIVNSKLRAGQSLGNGNVVIDSFSGQLILLNALLESNQELVDLLNALRKSNPELVKNVDLNLGGVNVDKQLVVDGNGNLNFDLAVDANVDEQLVVDGNGNLKIDLAVDATDSDDTEDNLVVVKVPKNLIDIDLESNSQIRVGLSNDQNGLSEAGELVADPRTGQLFLAALVHKGKKAAKKLVLYRVIFAGSKAVGKAVGKTVGTASKLLNPLLEQFNLVDPRSSQTIPAPVLQAAIDVVRASAHLAPYAAIPGAIVGGTIGAKYLLIKKLIAGAGFLGGFKKGFKKGVGRIPILGGLPDLGGLVRLRGDGVPINIDGGIELNLGTEEEVDSIPQPPMVENETLPKPSENVVKIVKSLNIDADLETPIVNIAVSGNGNSGVNVDKQLMVDENGNLFKVDANLDAQIRVGQVGLLKTAAKIAKVAGKKAVKKLVALPAKALVAGKIAVTKLAKVAGKKAVKKLVVLPAKALKAKKVLKGKIGLSALGSASGKLVVDGKIGHPALGSASGKLVVDGDGNFFLVDAGLDAEIRVGQGLDKGQLTDYNIPQLYIDSLGHVKTHYVPQHVKKTHYVPQLQIDGDGNVVGLNTGVQNSQVPAESLVTLNTALASGALLLIDGNGNIVDVNTGLDNSQVQVEQNDYRISQSAVHYEPQHVKTHHVPHLQVDGDGNIVGLNTGVQNSQVSAESLVNLNTALASGALLLIDGNGNFVDVNTGLDTTQVLMEQNDNLDYAPDYRAGQSYRSARAPRY